MVCVQVGMESLMRRSSFVVALAAITVSQVWAVYGATTGPGSSDSTFIWVGQAGGPSAVLIDPHWVITAAHVGGNTFTLSGTTYTADATYDNPNYDLHLMHFTNTFGGYYPLFSGNPIGQTVTFVGFGDSGTLRSDGMGYNDVGGAGTRRTALNVVGLQQVVPFNTWNTPELLCDLDAPVGNTFAAPYNRDWFGDGGPTANEGGLMGGDSGGGWMINVGGTWQVAAISTYIVDDPNAAPGDPNPIFAFGISGSAGADLTDPGIRQWITGTVPEPASTAVLAIGLAGLLVRRRRRSR